MRSPSQESKKVNKTAKNTNFKEIIRGVVQHDFKFISSLILSGDLMQGIKIISW
jgi:hypothetical protein